MNSHNQTIGPLTSRATIHSSTNHHPVSYPRGLVLPLLLLAATASNPLMAADSHAKDDDHDRDHGKPYAETTLAHDHDAKTKATNRHDEDEHNEAGHADNDHKEAGHEQESRETDGHGHGEGGHDEEKEAGVNLNTEQQKAIGLQVETLKQQTLQAEVSAPGELRLNQYASFQATTRIDAQVIERLVQLGSHVQPGQVLARLSSVDVAAAQGDLLITHKEWKRVRRLGRKVVSERRYQAAQIAAQQARARLVAFGVPESQIDGLLQKGINAANGEFDLLASGSGTVIEDSFVVGQMMTAGEPLFIVSDESILWIEAQLPPSQAHSVNVGDSAWVTLGNDSAIKGLPARVIQRRHNLSEATRTLGIRLEIANDNDTLHPGQFVQVTIRGNASSQKTGLVVPQAAVLRSPDGDWQIFIEEQPGRYVPQEIEVLRTWPDRMVIEGVEPGTRIVTKGAFFLQSEIAKSGFSIHNH